MLSKLADILFPVPLTPSQERVAKRLNEMFRNGELRLDDRTRVVVTDKGREERAKRIAQNPPAKPIMGR